jgi:protein-S-isoprenylcysteine O-methyltransferase Ste14
MGGGAEVDVDSRSLEGELPGSGARSLGAVWALPPTWFFALQLLMVVLHFAWPVAQWNLGMARWWGLPFAVLGIVAVVGAARQFRSVTTLMPFEEPTALVTGGFFRFSRNPMYLGMLLSIVGGVIMLGSLTPAIAIPLFVGLMQVRFIAHEERILRRSFTGVYESYRNRVRRWL